MNAASVVPIHDTTAEPLAFNIQFNKTNSTQFPSSLITRTTEITDPEARCSYTVPDHWKTSATTNTPGKPEPEAPRQDHRNHIRY